MAPNNVQCCSSLSSDQTSKSCAYGPARGHGSMNNGIHKRTPVIRVVHIFAPKRITTDSANFRALVQELTGNTANIKETSSASNEAVAHNNKQALAQPLVHSNTASNNTHEDSEPSFSQHPASERALCTGRRSEESAFDGDQNNYPMLYTYPNTVDVHPSPINYYNESSISWESCGGSSDDHSIDNFFGGDPDAIFHTDQQQSWSVYCGSRLPFHQEIPGGFDYF